VQVQETDPRSEHTVEDRRQMGDRVSEDEDRLAVGHAGDVAHEPADRGIPQRFILALGVEAAEQVARPRRVDERLVLDPRAVAPTRAKAGRQQRGARAIRRQGEEDRMRNGDFLALTSRTGRARH
jgi:hypothetical protein